LRGCTHRTGLPPPPWRVGEEREKEKEEAEEEAPPTDVHLKMEEKKTRPRPRPLDLSSQKKNSPSDKHQREASPAPAAAAADAEDDLRDNDGDLFATARDLLDLPRLSEGEGGAGDGGGERQQQQLRGEAAAAGEATPPAPPSVISGSGSRGGNSRRFAARPSLSDYAHVAVIGRGAFGEVRLVRELKNGGRLAALKSLDKAEMLRRRQVAHVRAERDALATLRALGGEGRRQRRSRRRRRKMREEGGARKSDDGGTGESGDGERGDDDSDDDDDSHVVALRASFQDERRLHLVMEYLPGGDLMTLLMRMDVLPVVRFLSFSFSSEPSFSSSSPRKTSPGAGGALPLPVFFLPLARSLSLSTNALNPPPKKNRIGPASTPRRRCWPWRPCTPWASCTATSSQTTSCWTRGDT
jgi:hypothetical protein